MELSKPLTLRLPVDLLDQVEKVAAASERSRSWVIVRALKLYMQAEGADILRIADGVAEADAGDTERFDDVLGQIERIVRDDAA